MAIDEVWCFILSLVFLIISVRILLSPHSCLVNLGVDYDSQSVSGKAELQAYYCGTSLSIAGAIYSFETEQALLIIQNVLGGFVVGRVVNYLRHGKDLINPGSAEQVFVVEIFASLVTYALRK